MTADLLESFALLEDPRIDRNKRHQLLDIVLPTVCAVVSGAGGGEGVEQFGRAALIVVPAMPPPRARRVDKARGGVLGNGHGGWRAASTGDSVGGGFVVDALRLSTGRNDDQRRPGEAVVATQVCAMSQRRTRHTIVSPESFRD